MTHPIPTAALDDRLAFVGNAGSGKTYAAGTAVERLLDSGARVVIPDPLGVWWGLALSKDGKSPSKFRRDEKLVIFGGPRGDLGLTEHSGALIGETVAGMAESCILDLSELKTGAAERRFMLAFLSALYKHKTREPLHTVFDEADMWAPQRILDREGEAMKLLGMMETICRRGRVKGFIPWLISQRPAVISKNVLSQIDGMIALKLTSVQDRDAIGDWVQGQADTAQWKAMWGQMATMPQGQGVVWLPARGVLKTAQFPEKVTFDSSRAPKRGERMASAKALTPVNLDKLKERLATVEAESKANDPSKLKAELAKAKNDKALLERQMAAAVQSKVVADPDAIKKAEERGFEQAKKKLSAAAAKEAKTILADGLTAIRSHIGRFTAEVDEELKKIKAQVADVAKTITFTPSAPTPTLQVAAVAPRPHAPSPAAPRHAAAALSDGILLGKGERIILTAIAQYPQGATREQLTVLTGYKKSSRDTYLQRLSACGFVAISGSVLTATQGGIDALGSDYEPLPRGADLQAYWMARLPEGEKKILAYLIEQYPHAVDRDDLNEPTGYKKSSRDTYIQRLGARMLVTTDRGSVKASDILFEGRP